MANQHETAVFSEPSGSRWQRVRTAVLLVGAFTSALMLALVAAILVPPSVPQFTLRPERSPTHRLPELNVTRAQRSRAAGREALYEALRSRPNVPAIRPTQLPLRAAALPQQRT